MFSLKPVRAALALASATAAADAADLDLSVAALSSAAPYSDYRSPANWGIPLYSGSSVSLTNPHRGAGLRLGGIELHALVGSELDPAAVNFSVSVTEGTEEKTIFSGALSQIISPLGKRVDVQAPDGSVHAGYEVTLNVPLAKTILRSQDGQINFHSDAGSGQLLLRGSDIQNDRSQPKSLWNAPTLGWYDMRTDQISRNMDVLSFALEAERVTPPLSVKRTSGNRVQVSWANYPDEYELQSSTDMRTWQSHGTGGSPNRGTHTMTFDMQGARFFRLQ